MSKTLYFIAPKAAPAPNVNNDFKPFFAAEIVRAKMITLGEFFETYLKQEPDSTTAHYRGYLTVTDEGYTEWLDAESFHECLDSAEQMDFAGAFFAMKKGYKVTRRDWGPENGYLIFEGEVLKAVDSAGTKTYASIESPSFSANDWMIIEQQPKMGVRYS